MQDKSPDRIRRMFDGIAPWYDFLNHFLSLGIDRHWRRKTARLLIGPDTPPGPVLDVCCGTGDLTLAFRRRVQKLGVNSSLAGIDFSSEMVEIARKKIGSESGAAIQVGDALALPFEPESFSVVAAAFGLRNVGDTQRGLAEMVRVCRPGGTVAVLEFTLPTCPVFAWPYRFYFRNVLPGIGRFFSRNGDAYRYLPESVLEFDDGPALRRRMESLGLTDIKTYPMTFGIATLQFGRVPKSEPEPEPKSEHEA